MNKTIYNWKLYCETDSVYKYFWSESQPTTCPYNVAHSITTNPGPEIVDYITDNRKVVINEEDGTTQGLYKLTGHVINIPNGEKGNVTTVVHTWPFPITLLNGWFHSTPKNVGDIINVTFADNTIVGTITSPVNVGNSAIQVSESVINNIYKGYNFSITDGSNISDLGFITSVDSSNSIVYSEISSDNNYSHLSPTYVKITVPIIENFTILVPENRYAFAEKKIGGKYIPANIPLYLKYQNNDTSPKKLAYNIEILY